MINDQKKLSKFLSLVLRHKPEAAGISLDSKGWVDIDILIAVLSSGGVDVTRDELLNVVNNSDKQRFAISDDGTRIRANQGHSVDIDLKFQQKIPPDVLLHGSAHKFLDGILSSGLHKMKRHHVHLTESADVARQVGSRHGKPVVLRIDSKAMYQHGHVFYRSDNGVWLVDSVAPEYLSVL